MQLGAIFLARSISVLRKVVFLKKRPLQSYFPEEDVCN